MHNIFESISGGVRRLGVTETPASSPRFYSLAAPLATMLTEANSFDVETAVREVTRTPAVEPPSDTSTALAPLQPSQETMLFISGFGLTHTSKMSADLQKGRPPGGEVLSGELPFWFLKGFAGSARLPGQALRVGPATQGICEEAELVLVYVVKADGVPEYAGFTFGNDLTDIARFRANKAQLSYCKLYDSGVLPTLYLGHPPLRVDGVTTVHRAGAVAWRREFETGIDRLFFDVEQMVGYMWQHATLLVPGSVHYVFLGADRNTTDFGFQMLPGDTVEIDFGAWGKLSNSIEAVDGRLTGGLRVASAGSPAEV